ncbi:MAG: 1,4-alpha-glucan branching protein GlgB [Bacteroidetes bacterium]|nr:1,4-alpha-glucan branching protein GlgB [Bacteroidota bacterium]
MNAQLRRSFDSIIKSDESHPYSILGPHSDEKKNTVTINAYLPFAKKATLRVKGSRNKFEMKRITDTGIFQYVFRDRKEIFQYKIIITGDNDEISEVHDPYSFRVGMSDLDLHLLSEGNHFRTYDKLGAEICSINRIKGVKFSVWAPNARSVSITGEFNDWKPGLLPMERSGTSGYWCLFVPGMKEGTMYKYSIKSAKGESVFKSDPYAFEAEMRPGNASVVTSLKKHKWKDSKWMKNRKKSSPSKPHFKTQPVSIYEVHLGSWKKDYNNIDYPNEWGYKNYRQLAHELVDYAREMNYTHVELLPVMEHPLDISWGYQVVNYFAPTSRYGTPEDFMYFVDHCHNNGIGVILDWVPSHFPTDAHGPAFFDGTQIYAYENPLKGFHKDWGTYVFDYGKNEVRNFLICNALFWFEKYHIDGLRVDAVASMLYLDYSRNEGEWIPNIHGGNENLEAIDFLKKLNETVHEKAKGVIMIAEESSSWPGVTRAVHLGGLGFDMKWNMGWMHDILAYFSMDPVFRKFHHGKLTFAIWYAFNENFLLPISHDEVVHLKRSVVEKMPGDEWHKFANLRLLFGFMFSHPGKKLNFMGNDIAQYKEWNSESALDWEALDYYINKKYHDYFRELNRLYCEYPAFHEDDFDSSGFQWLDFSDADNSVIAYVRYNKNKSEMLMFTFNMTPVLRQDYVLGVPKSGYYREILNSNAEEYGGTGTGNLGGVYSQNLPRFEFPYSVKVTLPPLAVNVYKYESLINETADPENKINKDSSEEIITEDETIKDEAAAAVEDTEIPISLSENSKVDIHEDIPTSEVKPEEPEIIDLNDSKHSEATVITVDTGKEISSDKTKENPESTPVKPEQVTAGTTFTADKDNSAEDKIESDKTEDHKDKASFDMTEQEMEQKIKEIINRIKKF